MADESEAPTPGVGFIDNPTAPDIFSTGATGFFIMGPNVGITFEAVKVNHAASPGPVSRVVVGRVVMSIDDTQRLALGLYDFLKQRGLDPANVVRSDADAAKPQ